jgi:hypothetical protein
VSDDKTVHLDERAADSQVNMVTSRPAVPVASDFVIWRGDATGLRIGFGLYAPAPVKTWIAPTRTPVTTGTLQTMLNAWLTAPAASATRYEYDLARLWTDGLIPAGRQVVDPAGLATVDTRYFSAEPLAAYEAREGWFPDQVGSFPPTVINTNLAEPWIPVSLPQDRTAYLSAGPSLAWAGLLTTSGPEGGPDIQSDSFRTYAAGQRVTEGWNDYPLHPGVNANPLGGSFGGLVGTLPSASRAGDVVTVSVTPFSDNTYGHLGDFTQTGVTGSYEVDENGSKIDGGTFAQGFYGVQEILGAAPSTVTLSLDASRPDPLSARTQTTWTWRSPHESGNTLPAGWFCADGTQNCAVEPMMTLEYHVAGLALDETVPPGAQSLGIDVGHLQLAAASAITGVTAQVSFDDGATWQAAAVTGSGTSYQARYAAPAGSLVTLRVTAADAAGGRVSETITRAYRIDS